MPNAESVSVPYSNPMFDVPDVSRFYRCSISDVHVRRSLVFIGDYLFWGLMRMAWLAGKRRNRSGIYRLRHVVIRPIICTTFKYVYLFSYRNTLILSFFIHERSIFGAGAVFHETAFIVLYRIGIEDAQHTSVQLLIARC